MRSGRGGCTQSRKHKCYCLLFLRSRRLVYVARQFFCLRRSLALLAAYAMMTKAREISSKARSTPQRGRLQCELITEAR